MFVTFSLNVLPSYFFLNSLIYLVIRLVAILLYCNLFLNYSQYILIILQSCGPTAQKA
jgi:hypothetical protein